MIKKYTLEDGSEFKTITIPKGTVLFHGLTLDKTTDHNNIERSNIKELFYNNFGFPNDKGYAIEPKRNVFFYPVPYVALSVDFFNIHIMYLTNYDLELLLLIKPAKLERESIRDPSIAIKLVESCSTLSEKDRCGFDMNSYDPCFTDFCIKNYKNIDGYIAIADTDQERFLIQYKKLLKKYGDYTKLLHIMPSIAQNNAGRIGIPEIVLHPFRRRRDECYYIPGRGYTLEKIIKYSINNQAQYNYFPLLYFTNVGIYHLKDLNIVNLNKILNSEIEVKNVLYIDTIFTLIDKLIEYFLSPEGVNIKGVKYNLTIDVRTGFYKMNVDKKEEDITAIKSNIYVEENNDAIDGPMFNYYTIPITYPLKKKHTIMGLIGRSHDLYINYDWRLAKKGLSLKNTYILNKGDIDKYDKGFHIDTVLERLDLKHTKPSRHHYTRRRGAISRKRITRQKHS